MFDEALVGRHMVFLAGPRQVGKTRLARPILAVEVRSSDTLLAGSLEHPRKWFPDDMPAAIQAVAKAGILQKQPNHTWVMSLHRLLSLLP